MPPDILAPLAIVEQLANPDPRTFFRTFTARPTITALGLLGLVDPKHPEKEVTVPATRILEITHAAQDIENRLSGKSGFHSKHFADVGDAMVALYTTELQVRTVRHRRKGKRSKGIKETEYRWIHFLDTFKYVYVTGSGTEENLDLLPDIAKVNISKSGDRAVYKLRDGRRPTRIGFRLNTELAMELTRRGQRTTFYGAVFELLRKLADNPGAIRTALWVIAHRDLLIKTNRTWLWEHLIAGVGNRTRAEREARVSAVLEKLQRNGVITGATTQKYAEASRKEGNYLILQKAESWHVPSSQEGGK